MIARLFALCLCASVSLPSVLSQFNNGYSTAPSYLLTFDSQPTTSALDSSQGRFTWVPEVQGRAGAAYFDRTSRNYIDLKRYSDNNGRTIPDVGGEMSVEIMLMQRNFANWQRTWAFSNNAVDANGFPNSNPTGDNICMGNSNTDTLYRIVAANASVESVLSTSDQEGRIAEWNHIVVTFQIRDPVATGNTQGLTTVYINGRQVANGTTFVPRQMARTLNWLGRSEYMMNIDASYMGFVDTFAVYSHPLSAEAVWARVHTSRPPVHEMTFAKNPTTLGNPIATPTYSWVDTVTPFIRGVVVLSGTSQSVNLLTNTGSASVGTAMSAALNGVSSGSPAARGWTYAVSVSITTLAANAPIFDARDAGTNRVRIYLTVDGNVMFVVNALTITSTTRLVTGRFYHIAAAVSATGNATLYIDNAAVGSATGSALTAFTATQAFLGQSTDATPAFLAGRFDSFRVYDVALTATEVAGLSSTLTTAPTGSLFAPTFPPVTQSHPVNSYTFSKPPPAFGSSGLTTFSYVPSLLDRQGMAFFDGTRSVINFRDFADDNGRTMATQFGGAMTFEVDFQYLAPADQAMVYSFTGPRGAADHNLHLMNTYWQAGAGNVYTLRSETYTERGFNNNLQLDCLGCTNGSWAHAIVSIQQPNISDSVSTQSALITMYINGILVSSKFGMLPKAVYRPLLSLGQSGWSGDQLFFGNIDSFHWYNYGLSPEAAAVHFLLPTPPLYEVVFYEDTRVVAGSSPTFGWQFNETVSSIHQGMIMFSGSNQFANLSATSDANFVGFTIPSMHGNGRNTPGVPTAQANGWAFDVVFLATSTASGATIVDMAAAGGASSLSLAFNANSEVVFTHGTQTLNCGSVAVNTWTHILITVAQAGSAIDGQCYKNGVRIVSRPDFPAIPYAVRNSVLLGKSNTAANSNFNGLIDAFRVMPYTLTSEDALELFTVYSAVKRVIDAPAFFSGASVSYTFDYPPPQDFSDPTTAIYYNYWTWSDYGPSYASGATNRRFGVSVYNQTGNSRALRQYIDMNFDQDAYGAVLPTVWGGSMSFEIWVNMAPGTPDLRPWSRLFDCAGSDASSLTAGAGEYNHNILLSVNGEGTLRELLFQHYATTGTAQPSYNIYVGGGFVPGTWQHVVATIQQTTTVNATMSLYINGVLRGTSPSPVPPKRRRQLCNIGRSNWDDSALNATIDSFYWYNYALSPKQITRNMRLPNPPYFDASFETNPAVATAPTYSWIDTEGTTSVGALTFNGVNQYVDLFSGSSNASIGQTFPSINGISIGVNQEGFSFELSAKWSSVTGNRRVFDLSNGGGVDSFAIGSVNNNAVLYIDNGLIDEKSVVPLFKITANNYYHLLVVGKPVGGANSTTMDYQIFVKGSLVATQRGLVAPSRLSRRVAYLGRSSIASDSYFQGSVDLLRYYTYAVDATNAAYLSSLTGPTADYVAPDADINSSSTGSNLPSSSSSSGTTTGTSTSTGTSTTTGTSTSSATSTPTTSTSTPVVASSSTAIDDQNVNSAVRSASTIAALIATVAFAVIVL